MDTLDLSRIAHELRTPLALIRSRLQLIEAEQPEMKALKNWIHLQESLQDMTTLVSRLTETATTPALSSTVDLPQLLCELMDDFIVQTDDASLTMSLQVSPEASPTATAFPGDRIRLKQIFTNLIKNAIEATEGLPARSIHLEISLVSTHLCVKFRDNGPGISADILPRLYMPYVTDKQHGTGIGLTITRQLVQECNGWLDAENHSDGAVFLVYLRLPSTSID